ncbi:MAG: hypothetical protein IKW39_05230 [Alphaproteobacteria bacterium]|nr:hypothetical protein [Alphaproteobacteria bacterium]
MNKRKKSTIIDKNNYIREKVEEGFSHENAEALYNNKVKRDKAIKRNKGDLAPRYRGYNNWIIRECDKKEKEIIKKQAEEWKETHPKKYAVYYIGEVNRMLNEIDKESDENKKYKMIAELNAYQDENDEWRLKNLEVYEEVKKAIVGDGFSLSKDNTDEVKNTLNVKDKTVLPEDVKEENNITSQAKLKTPAVKKTGRRIPDNIVRNSRIMAR